MREARISPGVCPEGGVHLWANWIDDKDYDWVICECCGLAHVLDEGEFLFNGKVLKAEAV